MFPSPLLCSLCFPCPRGLPDEDPKPSVPSWLEDSTVKGSWADTERWRHAPPASESQLWVRHLLWRSCSGGLHALTPSSTTMSLRCSALEEHGYYEPFHEKPQQGWLYQTHSLFPVDMTNPWCLLLRKVLTLGTGRKKRLHAVPLCT